MLCILNDNALGEIWIMFRGGPPLKLDLIDVQHLTELLCQGRLLLAGQDFSLLSFICLQQIEPRLSFLAYEWLEVLILAFLRLVIAVQKLLRLAANDWPPVVNCHARRRNLHNHPLRLDGLYVYV